MLSVAQFITHRQRISGYLQGYQWTCPGSFSDHPIGTTLTLLRNEWASGYELYISNKYDFIIQCYAHGQQHGQLLRMRNLSDSIQITQCTYQSGKTHGTRYKWSYKNVFQLNELDNYKFGVLHGYSFKFIKDRIDVMIPYVMGQIHGRTIQVNNYYSTHPITLIEDTVNGNILRKIKCGVAEQLDTIIYFTPGMSFAITLTPQSNSVRSDVIRHFSS